MSKEFKMGFIEEVEPLKLTTIPKKYQKLIEATENRWFNKMQKLAKMCQKRIDDLEHRLANCIELPKGLKVGSDVYYVCENCDTNKYYIEYGNVYWITEELNYREDGTTVWIYVRYKGGLTYQHLLKDFGDDLFATEEEAKSRLEELQKC